MKDRCIRGLDSLPRSIRGCVLTVGNFDGVHVGHQRIVRVSRSLSDTEAAPLIAMTFDPPPDLVLRPEDPPQRITPSTEKTRLLLECGCDFVVIAPSDKEFLAATAEEFIENTLVARFAPRDVVEGRNFFFGRERSGNVETLSRAAEHGGFRLHVINPVMVDLSEGAVRTSSTLIRSLILSGRVEDARRCMGRDFALFGKVIRGTGRGGRLLGFPTLNLDPGQQVCPGDGVYAGRANVEGEDYRAAISIGENPTLGGAGRTVEAYLLDWEGDFRNREVSLRLSRRIGDQKRFDSVEGLRVQIVKDVQRVRDILE